MELKEINGKKYKFLTYREAEKAGIKKKSSWCGCCCFKVGDNLCSISLCYGGILIGAFPVRTTPTEKDPRHNWIEPVKPIEPRKGDKILIEVEVFCEFNGRVFFDNPLLSTRPTALYEDFGKLVELSNNIKKQ